MIISKMYGTAVKKEPFSCEPAQKGSCFYFVYRRMSSSSTSKIKAAFGGMACPAPRSP